MAHFIKLIYFKKDIYSYTGWIQMSEVHSPLQTMFVRCGLKIPPRGLLFGITRLAEWCRTVIPSDISYKSHQTLIMDSCSCILFIRQLRVDLYTSYFINITLKCQYFRSRNVWYSFFLQRWCRSVWWQMTKKNDVMTSKTPWHDAWESSYTPWRKTTCPCISQSCGNSCCVCKNRFW